MEGLLEKTIVFCGAECSSNEEMNVVLGICEEAERRGWHVFVFNAQNNYSDKTKLIIDTKIFDLINYDNISGVLIGQNIMVHGGFADDIIAKCKSKKIPVLSVGVEVPGCNSIVFNNSECIGQMIDHLIEEHDARTFKVVGGFKGNSFSEQRIKAIKISVENHGLEFDSDGIIYGDFWEVPTKKGVREFLESGRPLPDAFVCCNDVMAIATCEVLDDFGFNVPKDTLVTGYDGIDFERFHKPRLSTIKCDTKKMGHEAVRIIIDLFDGMEVPELVVMNPTIIFSQSCGCNLKNIASTKNSLFEAMEMSAKVRTINANMFHLAALTSSCEKMTEIKKFLPNNGFYERNCWIMINEGFLDIKNPVEYKEENPFDDVIECFFVSRDDKIVEHIPIKRHEYIPDIEEVFASGITNFVVMTLYFGSEYSGYVFFPFEKEDATMDLISKERFARGFAQAIAIVKSREKLQYMNFNDLLTGIFNRRGFYHEFEVNMKNFAGGNMNLVLHSIDMDNLKYINDTFGHSEGDFSIKTLSKAIVYAGGPGIIAARFGGDEFVAAIFTNKNPNEVMEEFRSRLHKYLDDVNYSSGKPYQVGCSCGSHITNIPEGLKVDQVIARADELMYSEKSTKKRSRSRS